jgi:putative phage essential recombination function protein
MENKINIYQKMQAIKEELLEMNLKKSGENKFAKFSYYELSDFLPQIIKLSNKYKLFTQINFNKENGILTIIDAEEPNSRVEYITPTEELELKGCNKIQALGGTQTYLRRYLYMNAFDITENDLFDSITGKNTSSNKSDSPAPQVDLKTKIEGFKKWLETNNVSQDLIQITLEKYNVNNIDEMNLEQLTNVTKEIKEVCKI